MNAARYSEIASRFSQLRLAVIGDICLDRYFDIDPARSEISIETGLEVHNIFRVRCQPGAAGTILNNLAALGIGHLHPIGFSGLDGEGYELKRSLEALPGAELAGFIQSPLRRTFTYTKPLVHRPDQPPVELNRLDIKNWTPTPPEVENSLCQAIEAISERVDGIIVMDQVDLADTGVITPAVLSVLDNLRKRRPNLPIVADSRRSLKSFPPFLYKMNAAELARFAETTPSQDLETLRTQARILARAIHHPVVVTLAERGMIGATPDGETTHVPCLPLRGPIDIVGAGDSVTANLTACLAAGATLPEALAAANTAASVVIHQLGTTGTASISQISALLR